jgi:hypothetical protein
MTLLHPARVASRRLSVLPSTRARRADRPWSGRARSLGVAVGVAACALGAGDAAAAPFEARLIPEQVDAVGHLDVDALRRTQLFAAMGGQAALDAALDQVPADARPVAKALAQSLRSISFWYDDEHGALQIATAGARALGPMLGQLKAKSMRAVDGHTVYLLDQGGDPAQLAIVGDTIVLSDHAPSIDRAVRVLDGKAKSLAASPRLPRLGRAGVFFVAALGQDVLGKIQRSASSRLMKLAARTIVIDVAESGSHLVASARAEMASADALQTAKSIAEGVRALASFADDPRVVALVNGVSVTAAGLTLEVSAKAPVAELAKLIPRP